MKENIRGKGKGEKKIVKERKKQKNDNKRRDWKWCGSWEEKIGREAKRKGKNFFFFSFFLF